MKNYLAHPMTVSFALCMALAVLGTSIGFAVAQSRDIEESVTANGVTPSSLQLTAAQKSAIYQEVHKDRSKVEPSAFATDVGAEVPPMIELYSLPDDILATTPETKLYKFTRVDDRIVLVDPTEMRVVAVIGPKSGE
jgi:hypothetical protein